MEKSVIYSHSSDAEKLKIKKSEVLRYMGQRETDKRIDTMIDSLICKCAGQIRPKACFMLCDLEYDSEKISLFGMKIYSKSLKKNLDGCQKAIIMVLTIGTDADRMIESSFKRNSAEGVCTDAIMTAFCEEYADILCGEIEKCIKDEFNLRPRFSPGYGDFDIGHQKDFIRITDAVKRCGVSVTDALMLVPAKSVSAIMGLERK